MARRSGSLTGPVRTSPPRPAAGGGRRPGRSGRRRRGALAVLALSVAGLVLSGLRAPGGPGGRVEDRGGAPSRSAGAVGSEAAALGAGDRGPATVAPRRPEPTPTPTTPFEAYGAQAFARVRDLVLYLPAHHVLGVGYHQAKSPLSLPLRPLGRAVRNDNREDYRAPRATAGPNYIVLVSRQRGTAPTSAVDVAVGRREPVRAPVSGMVREVRQYLLYGLYPDLRVELDPRDGSGLIVVIIHLTKVQVREGQRVVAGETPIGFARVLPDRSYINDYVGEGVPHVHIEVKERGPSGG
ncbi:MAG TPA: M23 family metallopeptidase [Actinomycetota bacterium]|nr:M23 family metallopeptidase [Actinomycetota bacterium]